MNPVPSPRLIDAVLNSIDRQQTSADSLLIGPFFDGRADEDELENQALVLAVAFSARDTLARSSDIGAQTPAADVPELLRPSGEALRTLRELEQLGMPLALVGDLPQPVLDAMAAVLWFSGHVVSAADPLVTLPITFGFPPACIWLVTADGDEAQRAVAAGFTAVHIASGEAMSSEPAGDHGLYRLNSIEDLLEAIRAPYTRSALNLRLVIGGVLYAKLDGAAR